MKIEYLLSIIFFFNINSSKNNSIIRIPDFEGRYENISTKFGLINYEFRVITEEVIKWPVSSSIYRLEGIKNLNLLNFTEFKYCYITIYGKNKDSIKLNFHLFSQDIFNDEICKLLYKTKYIDKMIYSYGIINNKNYKYFGGTPENIIKSKKLKKFTFNKDDRISKIIIRSSEDSYTEIHENEILDALNGKGMIKIEDDKDFMICIPNTRTKLLKLYKIREYQEHIFRHNKYYQLDKRQHKFFESISFMIGNKNITLNRDKILFQSKETNEYFLAIRIDFCNEFTFGKKFIKLFDFSEFNMETEEVSLFMNQKEKIISEKEVNNENKKEVLNSNIIYNYYIAILLLSFIVFMMSITLVKNYHKNKKIQYYNEYYTI